MISTTSTASLVYLIVGGLALLAGLFGLYAVRFTRSAREKSSYDKQLEELISNGPEEDALLLKDKGGNISEKWVIYWRQVGVTTGFPRYVSKNNKMPRDIFFIALAFMVAAFFLTGSPVVTVLAGPISIAIVGFLYRNKYKNQDSVIQDQLPGFLFALKANVQANETPSRAIVKVVDNMPDPLRSDLMIVKQKLLASATFAEALEAMIERTNSNELKFLASCLIQAASTGANIEPQITTIQNVLDSRKEARDELNRAVKASKPAIYVSSIAIPGSFIASYIMDSNGRAFWFHTLLSWVVLFVVAALYGVGLWATKRMVDNIRNL